MSATYATRSKRKYFPGALQHEAEQAQQSLDRLPHQENLDQRFGFAAAIADQLVALLRRQAKSLTSDYAAERTELVALLADHYWVGNEEEFTTEWEFVARDEIADWLAAEWREALGKLPEVMAEWVWDLWEDVCPPDDVADVLWQRVAERTIIEVEFDSTPDPDHTHLLNEEAA